MIAVLDHVGIAVTSVDEALAFFRDALGLDVRPAEEVPSQGVRVRYLPAGGAALELLEATGPQSPVSKFLERRGSGLHHITLRVDDLPAALARLRDRGVRLIDERPRIGSGGARIAFIHPSSAHGVLVELKEAVREEAGTGAEPGILRIPLGDVELISVSDGFFRLDGGAMFGVVPKPLWERRVRPDDRNRIRLGLRPLVVRGVRTMLIDAGVGDKLDAKSAEIHAFERARHLDHTLTAAGLSAADIDVVLATHLHFDHAGGFTARTPAGTIAPRFPRAQYVIRRGEWDDATHPNERTRASYLAENFQPLADAGVLQLVDEDVTIMPGVRVRRTGGHTPHHQLVLVESGGRTAAFVADLIPTAAHLAPAWIMGYDVLPLETLAVKRAFVREAIEREYLVFFEHDPEIAAGYIRERDGRPFVDPVQPR